MSEASAILEIDGVRKSYGRKLVLDIDRLSFPLSAYDIARDKETRRQQ